ncbi:MAG: hypothetical protein ACLR8Y_00210 [Alistipes indistinctus]
MVSDSVVLVQADGLHLFNLYTGQGWDYEAVMSAPYDKRIALQVLGFASSSFATGGAYMIKELHSNAILSDSVLLLGFA